MDWRPVCGAGGLCNPSREGRAPGPGGSSVVPSAKFGEGSSRGGAAGGPGGGSCDGGSGTGGDGGAAD